MIEPALIGLLYRADWTRLSLAADVSLLTDYLQYEEVSVMPGMVRRRPADPLEPPGPSERAHRATGRLLIAPGGRYRLQTIDADGRTLLRGCDGERCWQQAENVPDGHETPVFGRHMPPLPALLNPSGLLSGYQLTMEGAAIGAAGRDAYRLVAMPRPVIAGSRVGAYGVGYRVEAVVDATLGILVRWQTMVHGQVVSLDELWNVRLEPPEAADPAQFVPPPGSTIAEPPGALFSGAGWRAVAVRTVARIGSAGLGFVIRHAPRRRPLTPADEEAAMPRGEPETASTGGRAHTQAAISDELLSLLYRSGLTAPHFAAELHEWEDHEALAEGSRSSGETALIPGLGVLVDAMGERAETVHHVWRLRVAALDRYRIDYVIREAKREPKTVACDGQRRWRVYDNRVVVGPAVPLPDHVAELVDVAWLLGCELSGSEVTVHGRRALRFSVAGPRCPGQWRATGFLFPAEVVVDAELGIMLELTSYAGDRPAVRFELRDVTRLDEQSAGDFRVDIAPGTRVVDELDAPERVKLAARLAGQMARRAATGAAAVSAFVEGVRGRRPPGTQR